MKANRMTRKKKNSKSKRIFSKGGTRRRLYIAGKKINDLMT